MERTIRVRTFLGQAIDTFKEYIKTKGNLQIDYSLEEYMQEILDYIDYLEKENQELKKKYENAVADYETTMFEKEQLNSLVNSCQEEIRQLKKQLETYKKLGFKYLQDKNNNLETQQKEFVKYLEDEIQQQEIVIAENQEKSYFLIYEDDKEDLKLSSQKAYIKRIILEEILRKYKSIIGVSNENN